MTITRINPQDFLPLSGGTVTGQLDINNYMTTTYPIWVPSVELRPTSTSATNGGFLDFHYANASVDYTSRIIEDGNGRVSIWSPNGLRINNNTLARYPIQTGESWSGTTGYHWIKYSDGTAEAWGRDVHSLTTGVTREHFTPSVPIAFNASQSIVTCSAYSSSQPNTHVGYVSLSSNTTTTYLDAYVYAGANNTTFGFSYHIVGNLR